MFVYFQIICEICLQEVSTHVWVQFVVKKLTNLNDMKTYFLHATVLSFLTFLSMFIVGCGDIDLSKLEEAEAEKAFSTVRVLTRGASASEDIYPLRIYAFGNDGSLKTSQVISSSDDAIQLTLPTDVDVRIVAMVADEATYNIPATPTSTSLLTTKAPVLPENTPEAAKELAKGYVASHPLQMGFADIRPTSSNATVSLQMHYQMAAVNITLAGLPDGCTSAYVSIASPANAISMVGTLDSNQTSVIPLVYNATDKVWASGEVYLFPTTGTQTNFTVAYHDAAGEHFAVVSYLSTLKPGTPYVLQGTLADGNLVVSGVVSASQWGEPVNMNFVFSPDNATVVSPDENNSSEEPGGSGDTNIIPTISVDAIPASRSLWNGHIVVHSSPGEVSTEATLLLFSLEDFSNVASAVHYERPTEAADIATRYTEYDLESWRIPTEDEARFLRDLYLEYSDELGELFDEAQATPVVVTDDKDNNIRYLCSGAQRTYSFRSGSGYNSIKNAGAAVENYHLRLVKTVKVQVKK